MYTILNPLARDGKPLRLERLTPARDPAPAEGAVPDLLRHPDQPPHPAARAGGRRRRDRLERVRGAGGAQLHRETIDTAWLALEQWVAPRVLGRAFAGPAEVFPALQHNFRGTTWPRRRSRWACGRSAAEQRGVSLARLLGGTRSRSRSGSRSASRRRPAALVERARRALEEGYRKVKIKIEPGADVEYVRAVREALGPEAPLMADANNAYTLDDMPNRCSSSTSSDLMMIEQPLAWDDLGSTPSCSGGSRRRSASTSRSPRSTAPRR